MVFLLCQKPFDWASEVDLRVVLLFPEDKVLFRSAVSFLCKSRSVKFHHFCGLAVSRMSATVLVVFQHGRPS